MPVAADARPNAPRIYDYLIGGHESYAEDRALAEQLAGEYPGLRALARQNRGFILKAARWTASHLRIAQFLDLGCGLPMQPDVHTTVREVEPDARVVYLDIDPAVVLNTRAAYRDVQGLAIAEGDASDPGAVLAEAGVRGHVDWDRPACVILGGTLSAMDASAARSAVAGYAEALAPGSSVIISCISYGDEDIAAKMAGLFSGTGPWTNHLREDMASFFAAGHLRLTHARIMDVRCWPTCPVTAEPQSAAVLGGIGIKG